MHGNTARQLDYQSPISEQTLPDPKNGTNKIPPGH